MMKKVVTAVKNIFQSKQFYVVLIIWVALMAMHLRGYYLISPAGIFPTEFLVLTVTTVIGMLIQKHQKKQIEASHWYTLVVGIVMTMNYGLFRLGVSFFNYVVLFVTVGFLLCVDRLSKKNQTAMLQGAFVLLLMAGFLSMDYTQYQERLIKDHQLDQFIREEYHFSHPVSEEELAQVDQFYLSRRNRVSRLDGLEYFTGLTQIGFYDAAMIQDMSPVADIPHLERVAITGGDLDELNQLPRVEKVKRLEIVYPERGYLKTLGAFPTVRDLSLHGVDSPEHYDALRELDISTSLEGLGLAVMKEVSFEELSHFKSLKELRFFRVNLVDIEYLQELEQLEKIAVQYVTVEDESRFQELLQELEIELDNRG